MHEGALLQVAKYQGKRRYSGLPGRINSADNRYQSTSIPHPVYFLLHRAQKLPKEMVFTPEKDKNKGAEEEAAASPQLRYTENKGQRDSGEGRSTKSTGVVFRELEHV